MTISCAVVKFERLAAAYGLMIDCCSWLRLWSVLIPVTMLRLFQLEADSSCLYSAWPASLLPLKITN